MSDRFKLTLLLLFALAQGVLYMIIVPPWQHYDEPTHFEYAWLIANQELLPEPDDIDTWMRRDVLASMVRYDFFEGTPPQWLNDTGQVWLGILELTHPPAYYAYLAVALSPASFLDMTAQLHLARAMTVLLYLGTIAFLYFTASELTPPGHTLRWFVPLTAMLIGPFANQMTAVNNDAASAFSLTLFLWMAVRLVRRGFSFVGLVLLAATALLAVLSKNTTALAVALMPHVFVLVLWIRRRLPWRWFWLGAGALGALFLLLFFESGDAAYWYRFEQKGIQLAPTRSAAPPGAVYPFAAHVTVDPADPQRKLLNPLFPDQVRQIAGGDVTVGGWVWASTPHEINGPGLLISNRNSTDLLPYTQPMTVTTAPSFVYTTFSLPEEVTVAYYSLFGSTAVQRDALFDLYLQDAFVIEGEYPAGAGLPALGEPLPAAVAQRNLIRNGTVSEGWPRLRTWVDMAFNQYLRRSPSYIFSAALDVRRNAPFLLGTVAPYLLNDLFVAYGWGHIRVGEPWWLYGFAALITLCSLGALFWLRRSSGRRAGTTLPALSVLAVTGLLVWFAALLWPLPYNWARLTLPSARYTFAAITPTAFFLAAGWWGLWTPRWRPAGIALLLILLAALNVAGIVGIVRYYSALS